LVRIESTLRLHEMWVAESLWQSERDQPSLRALGEPAKWPSLPTAGWRTFPRRALLTAARRGLRRRAEVPAGELTEPPGRARHLKLCSADIVRKQDGNAIATTLRHLGASIGGSHGQDRLAWSGRLAVRLGGPVGRRRARGGGRPPSASSGDPSRADRVHALTVQVRARLHRGADGRRVAGARRLSSASGVLLGDGLVLTGLSAVTLRARTVRCSRANEIEVVVDDVGPLPARLSPATRASTSAPPAA